jgi:hypothetical protein
MDSGAASPDAHRGKPPPGWESNPRDPHFENASRGPPGPGDGVVDGELQMSSAWPESNRHYLGPNEECYRKHFTLMAGESPRCSDVVLPHVLALFRRALSLD